MSDTKPLSFITSTVTLNNYQKEEFDRISLLYNRTYNQLLDRWYRFFCLKSYARIDYQDARFIEQLTQEMFVRPAGTPRADHEEDCLIIGFASRDLIRHLMEREPLGLPVPHPELAPMTKYNSEVVFYRDYNIRVKERSVRVPVIGKAATGRYRYFSGSIRAVGIARTQGDEFRCTIYYKENQDLPPHSVGNPREDNARPAAGPDAIPLSPLNQKLRSQGIGFML